MSNNWFGALPFDWPILINTAELHFYFNAQDKWPNMVLFGLLSRDGNLGYLCFSPVPSRRVRWVRQGEGPRGVRRIRNSILFCWQSPPSRPLPIKLGSHQSCSTFGTVRPVSIPVRGHKERFTQVKKQNYALLHPWKVQNVQSMQLSQLFLIVFVFYLLFQKKTTYICIKEESPESY